MNEAEREAVGLCIALEAVNDIANHALVEIRDVSAFPGEAEVYYHTEIHQQLFLVRLLDFAKESTAPTLTGVTGSCLDVLGAACESKTFDAAGSVVELAQAVTALRDWLSAECTLTLWLPTLATEAELSLTRSELVFILGNHVKHNLARLTGVSRRIAGRLTEHGYTVQAEQVPLALDDFRIHLQDDYFIYYGTWLVELINNVRWGLQEYLMPAFQTAYRPLPDSDAMYEYLYPSSLSDPIARQWFWRLMNHVRDKPYIKRFTGAHYLKKASSLERRRRLTQP